MKIRLTILAKGRGKLSRVARRLIGKMGRETWEAGGRELQYFMEKHGWK